LVDLPWHEFAKTIGFSHYILELEDNKGGMKMGISVVVVTYNRPEEVKKAVDSLVNQSVKPFEIIIVDNGSSPPLSMKVDGSGMKLIRFDEEAGLSRARNYAINVAKGEYIAFIDDDCIASKHWIEEIQRGIRAGADILGGPLRPIFRAKPPNWWNEKDLGYIVGVGNSKTRNIWGGNMVFRRDFFRKIGVFNPNIGRQKGKLFSGEDSDLIRKGKERCKVLFMPNAEVFHIVKSERLTLSYIMRWSYNSGKSQRIARGPSLGAFYSILKILITMVELLNLFIKSEKSARIKKVAVMAELVGAIV
jgi:glycosyltransferase involved in cell wall biosynthesis